MQRDTNGASWFYRFFLMAYLEIDGYLPREGDDTVYRFAEMFYMLLEVLERQWNLYLTLTADVHSNHHARLTCINVPPVAAIFSIAATS